MGSRTVDTDIDIEDSLRRRPLQRSSDLRSQASHVNASQGLKDILACLAKGESPWDP